MMKIALFVFLLILSFFLLMMFRNFTPPSSLGVVDGELASLPDTPNAVSSQTDDATRVVAPFPMIGTLAESKKHLLEVLAKQVDIEVRKDDGKYLHAIAITKTMKYRDDLEFLFDEDAKIIHFRSASRVGYSDMGVNRQRYDKLRSDYLGE